MNGPVSNPDTELLRRIGHGDAAAFAEFYDRHAALLFGLAVKILLAPAEAEEVFQDSCVAIWERAPVAGAERRSHAGLGGDTGPQPGAGPAPFAAAPGGTA